MTERLYLNDSYLKEFDATVVAAEGELVLLDRSAFFPGGGGQQADRGELGAGGDHWQVAGFERRGDELWHRLDQTAPSVGTTVHGRVDWDFRYRMMRTHTALHVLCGIVFHEFDVLVTGCQMYPDRARMDFALQDLSKERIAQIEAKVAQAIAANLPVAIRTVPREEAFQIPDLIRTQINLLPPEIKEVRTVEIVGLDLQADGGTHVRSTAEVGGVRIVKTENKGKINKRIEIVVQD